MSSNSNTKSIIYQQRHRKYLKQIIACIVAKKRKSTNRSDPKSFEIMSQNFFLDWLLFCSIWRNHEELSDNRKSNFICLEKEEVFQDCLEQQQQLHVREADDEGQHPLPSVDYSTNSYHNPTLNTEINIANENQDTDGNATTSNQKFLLRLEEPPQSILGDRDFIEKECIGFHAGNLSMQLGEEEQLNKASLIEKQLIIKNSSDAKAQSGNELQLTEDDYQRKISSLQLQLENYEKASSFTIQQKLQQLHIQCENQLLVSKREMDAVRNEYENKIDILHLQLTSMEEEKKKYQLGVNEIETEKVRDLQNEIRLLEARCAEQQAAQNSINTENYEKLSMLQSQLTEAETEKNRTLQRQVEQIEKQYAERELKQKQIIVQTISSEYQRQISSLRRQLIECETEKVQCIQREKIQLEHELEAMKAKLDDTVAASTEYLSEVSALRMEMVHLAKCHEVQIKSLQEQHSKEITELINQLDDFIEEQDESSCKKDEAIASLSSQLVEARAVATELEHEKMILKHQNEVLEKSICLLQDGALKQKAQFEREMEQIRKESQISLEREQNIRKELSQKVERYELALKESKCKELSYKNQLESAMHELDKSQINCEAAQSSLAHLISLKHNATSITSTAPASVS